MNPILTDMFNRIRKSGRTLDDIARQAGVSVSTIKAWRRHEPKLGNIEAVLHVLGGKMNVTFESDRWRSCDWCGAEKIRGMVREGSVFCGRCHKPLEGEANEHFLSGQKSTESGEDAL